MGKVTQIKMIDPKMVIVCAHTRCEGSPHTGYVGDLLVVLGQWREKWVETLQRSLPEPMASLSAGILLGVKGQMPKQFYDALVNTGTLHIVAASGYNVSIVATIAMRVIGGFVSRNVAIVMGIVAIIVYVFLAGGSASVLRAGIMGSLTLVSFYFGRPAEANRLLFVTAGIMLLIDPILIFDIGFQLSFVATAGLLYLEPLIENKFQFTIYNLQFTKKEKWESIGAIATALPLAQAIGRIGNGVNGEFGNLVFGIPWWAAEAMLDLMLFVLLRGRTPKWRVWIYLVGYGLIRFFLQPYR